ncbi:hypothetical protein [Parafilimonas terrae]|uniref:Uncharacterized protein n=1 Tax=Parafilimonas terrae TaxID=1465490 RepID=A0A1I5WBA1_9BACT|nr:hypothetical protein [Parafilimonas terrae]SFQ16935.1 hypothetical protein SAMN05444277_10669 [Parafilimonas terrae]
MQVKGKFIFMAGKWNKINLENSRYMAAIDYNNNISEINWL